MKTQNYKSWNQLHLMSRLKVLLVIPVYNHGSTLGDVVRRAIPTGFPVLVVDDGSTDGGLDRVAELNCYTLRFSENRGKGAAILAAAEFAAERRYDAILTIDADGQQKRGAVERFVGRALPARQETRGLHRSVHDRSDASAHGGA